jgi:hypothetical protein
MTGDATAHVEERWCEFWADHKDFDPPWVRSVLHELAEILPFVFEFDAVGEGVSTLYRESGVQIPADFEWNSADEDLPAGSLVKLPIWRRYLGMRAYAYYGLKFDSPEETVHDMDAFLDSVKLGVFPQWWLRDDEVRQAIHAVFARRKLDFPERGEGLTADELAALARVSRKSIANLLAPSSGDALRTREDGSITVESAQLWLSRRADFRSSIWHLQGGAPFGLPDQEVIIDGGPVFVPVTSDGSWFSPEHQRHGGFHVASAEQEETFEDYWDALEFLSCAASPRWRYPDKLGRWYMKAASGWDRKARKDIDTLLEREEKARAQKGERKK